MRTCGKCAQQTIDEVLVCPRCGADLRVESTNAQALRQYREGGRVTEVRILADRNCCPTCREASAVYPIDQVPALPIEGCSHAVGCRCVYEPVLDMVGA